MRVIRLTSVFVLLLALAYGCVFPYEIDVKGADDILVVNGHVSDREGYHYIEISRTIPFYHPDEFYDSGHPLYDIAPREAIPVIDCIVAIQDDKGNVFTATESDPGKYACWIDGEYLTYGTQFQLTFTTRDGKNYASEIDELLACPEIDSINWAVEERMKENTLVPYLMGGVQFYVSTDCSGDYAKNFRWALSETWEYHTTYMIEKFWDGRVFQESEAESDSLHICYYSGNVNEIFTYSLRNLTSGLVSNFPINYVSERSERLSNRYSLLVRQMALTPAAYEYWSILEDLPNQTAELFEVLPAEIPGNILCLDNEEERVLGLFFATSIQEKRIFVQPNIYTEPPTCVGDTLSFEDLKVALLYWSDYVANFRPAVYFLEEPRGFGIPRQACFDCRLGGGTLQKPSFW